MRSALGRPEDVDGDPSAVVPRALGVVGVTGRATTATAAAAIVTAAVFVGVAVDGVELVGVVVVRGDVLLDGGQVEAVDAVAHAGRVRGAAGVTVSVVGVARCVVVCWLCMVWCSTCVFGMWLRARGCIRPRGWGGCW